MPAAVEAVTMIPASIPSPSWSGFDLGPFTLHAYALCILAGIAAAIWLTSKRWDSRGGPEGSIWDIAIWAIPFGIIGGRLYHVFSSPDAYFGPDGDLWLIPQLWLGGLGIWGAIVLGAVGAWIGCRRAGVKLTAFMDAAAPGVLLAQAIGRWGNWFNQELFGAPTTLPWGLQIDPNHPNFPDELPADTLFHPTFLYESLWSLAGVALLLVLDRKFNFRGGRLFWLYAAYYTLGRVWIEALRIDDAELIFGVRLNVWTSILVFLFSVAAFVVIGRRQQRATPAPQSVYLPGHEPAEADSAAAGAAAADPNVTTGADTDPTPADAEQQRSKNDDDTGEETTPSSSERANLVDTGRETAHVAPREEHPDRKQ